MLNVRFAIAERGIEPPPGWRKVSEEGNAVLLENEKVIDRAFVPLHVVVGYDDALVSSDLREVTDFRDRAWITAPLSPQEQRNGRGRVAIRRARYGYALDAEMEGNGWIVVSETAWQGWRAYVDGRRVHTYRANLAFLSIWVPRGRHTLRLVYWPESFVIGRAVSGATLLAILVVTIVRRLRQHRRPTELAAGDRPTR